MAGIGYLFVRGLAGPDTPVVGGTPCGVFAWRPPDAMIAAASRVLAGLRSATADSGAPEPPRSISGTCR
jgi:exodeoxyribonuclease V beta subunit